MSDNFEEVKELMAPILDLFSGADGAVGFAKLRAFVMEMKTKADATPYSYSNKTQEVEFMTMVERFSKLCAMMMEPTTQRKHDD